MTKGIIAWSARNKLFVLLITAVAVGFAIQTLYHVPVDAIPDLSDTQVIVYSRWDRSPDLIEDQVTYPITTALLGTPKVKAIRGFSDFGYSFVYVIFEDGTDVYWARSRVLEYLSKTLPRLPEGVRTEIGPDATGVGWVYQYALVDRTGKHDLAQLRSFQDWYLRYWLQAVPGVAEVASIGGYEKQYQVQVDPNRLLAYKIPVERVLEAVRSGNADAGGGLIEIGGAEYMVRARGYARSVSDIERIVVGGDGNGVPVLVRDLATVSTAPAPRRGIAELDGEGGTVGGIVVMRSGENALQTIDRVKAKLAEVAGSLPDGVEIVPTYDRSGLIHESIATLRHELIAALLIVSFVILLFLWHIPSAIVPIVTIPVAVLLAFVPMYFLGVTSNIMSIAGIAISIGVLVDGAIIEVENAYHKLELWHHGGRRGDFHAIRLAALQEVAPAVFFSLLVVAVAFLPIFTLVDQEGRLFKPLAYTKTLAMGIAAILALTLDPAMRMLFTRMEPWTFRPRFVARLVNAVTVGTYYTEERHPVSRLLFALYEPVCRAVLRWKKTTIAVALLVVATTIPIYFRLGREFMPPLDEGTLLYMPITLPGVSVSEMERLLQTMDGLLKDTPEVFACSAAGRARPPRDPAPLSGGNDGALEATSLGGRV
jgi:Cu(I)/Ag(I) efflux system membrane protein CusA/SilA